jgi:hypothetical protein
MSNRNWQMNVLSICGYAIKPLNYSSFRKSAQISGFPGILRGEAAARHEEFSLLHLAERASCLLLLRLKSVPFSINSLVIPGWLAVKPLVSLGCHLF